MSIKTSLSSDSNASEIVSFRIPRARHNLLALRARERGKKSPDLLAKEVILNYLMGKPENLLETALTNVHAGQKKLYRRLHALSELFVFWLTSLLRTPSGSARNPEGRSITKSRRTPR